MAEPGTKKKKKKKSANVAPKRKVKAKVKRKTYDEPKQKSAMLKSIERQERLGQTMPLGSLTAELPILNRSLDGPEIHLFKGTKKKRKKIDLSFINFKKVGIICGIIFAVLLTAIIVFNNYTVDTVVIEGNVHYTNDEIYNMVMGDSKLSHNSIYLSFKYKNKEIENIPFIQTMSVKIVDSSTIRILVYEKAVAGFVEYQGRYFYFDKDGTVIESSNIITKGIPQVMGLEFDHIVLYETLPVENDEIFKHILEMTQLLEKYDIEMDKLYFDKSFNMTLYFGEARIKVGDFSNIDEKIIKLKTILPKLEGKKGVLRLDGYDGKDSIITFELDEE